MARKKANIHYLYKTTCKVTGRYYIGMHSTTNLEDGYMGSGKRLRHSIRKYGKENHVKEILEFFDNREDLAKREKEVVNHNLIKEELCMNLTTGGLGAGFMNDEHMSKCSKAGSKAFQDKLKNPTYKEKHYQKMSLVQKKSFNESELRKETLKYDWTGRNHTEETKKLISDSNKYTGVGKDNSQYGTVWITNGSENKKIKRGDNVPDGWSFGRRVNVNGELVGTSKLNENDVRQIKVLLNTKITQSQIALMFNVKQETISKIKRGLIWVNI